MSVLPLGYKGASEAFRDGRMGSYPKNYFYHSHSSLNTLRILLPLFRRTRQQKAQINPRVIVTKQGNKKIWQLRQNRKLRVYGKYTSTQNTLVSKNKYYPINRNNNWQLRLTKHQKPKTRSNITPGAPRTGPGGVPRPSNRWHYDCIQRRLVWEAVSHVLHVKLGFLPWS